MIEVIRMSTLTRRKLNPAAGLTYRRAYGCDCVGDKLYFNVSCIDGSIRDAGPGAWFFFASASVIA